MSYNQNVAGQEVIPVRRELVGCNSEDVDEERADEEGGLDGCSEEDFHGAAA